MIQLIKQKIKIGYINEALIKIKEGKDKDIENEENIKEEKELKTKKEEKEEKK